MVRLLRVEPFGDCDAHLICRHCSGQITFVGVHIAKVSDGNHHIMLAAGALGHLASLLKSLLGVSEASRPLIQSAKQDPGPGVVGIEFDGLLVGLDRLISVIQVCDRAEISRGFGRLCARGRPLLQPAIQDFGERCLGRCGLALAQHLKCAINAARRIRVFALPHEREDGGRKAPLSCSSDRRAKASSVAWCEAFSAAASCLAAVKSRMIWSASTVVRCV